MDRVGSWGRTIPFAKVCAVGLVLLARAISPRVWLHGQAGSDSSRQVVLLYTAGLHTFSLLRSGVEIDDAATGVRHPASHRDDALLEGTGGARRDLTGGWYNAGDYGKWSTMTAISVSYMLRLYALQEGHGTGGDPRLLEEAEWGLAWLLKMRDADGGVRHKIDSGRQFAWGRPPQDDLYPRRATASSTLDTADFVAVSYQAERRLRLRRPVLAAKYRQAADASWFWLQTHPRTSSPDPFYPDDDSSQEVFWAECEHILSHPEASRRHIESVLLQLRPHEVSWADPGMLGVFSLALEGKGSARRAAVGAIILAAAELSRVSRSESFGVAMRHTEFTWGSMERLLHRTALLEMADNLQPGLGFLSIART